MEPASEPTKPDLGPPDPEGSPLGLFQGYGVEIEWMIVNAVSLDVAPRGDALLGSGGEVDRGGLAWSNELVLHLLEVKTNGPAPSLSGLAAAFHGEVLEADRRLEPLGCRLLSGPVHPWMDPDRETRIWPHEYTEVYGAFHRLFGVRGHGWANLQSTHLNLPFSGDGEFAALHQAIRLVLPLLPGLAAASPVLEGVVQPNLDERMERYRTNALRIPSVAGGVIPDPVRTQRSYEEELLRGIYRDMEPLDPAGILRHEWVNARGAIARFQRGAVEIRVVDTQESPAMDLAVLALTVEGVRRLVAVALDQKPGPGGPALEKPATGALRALLADAVREGERAPLRGPRGGREREEALAPLLEALGIASLHAGDLGELWAAVAHGLRPRDPAVERLLREGTLARRILAALGRRCGVAGAGRELRPGETIPRGALRSTWEEVGDALRSNGTFLP